MSQKEDTYDVEKIVGHRIYKKKTQYKIRWLGFGSEEDTWEDEENLNCPDLLEKYQIEQLENKHENSSKEEGSYKKIIKSNPPILIINKFKFAGKDHVRTKLKDSTYASFLEKFVLTNFPNIQKKKLK